MTERKGLWLKTRLQEVNKTPTALCRHLGMQQPYVYEVINGRRDLQADHVGATAAFLDWPESELQKRLGPH